MFAVPREQCARIHASSGTTGKPTVVGYTQKDIDTWAGVMARSIRASGARPGDLVHVSYGYGLFTGGWARTTAQSGWPDGGALRRRADRAPGAADQGLQARHHHGHAQLRWRLPTSSAPGHQARPNASLHGILAPSPGPTTCGWRLSSAWHRRGGHLRPVGGQGPASPTSAWKPKDGPTIWEDHFYPEIIDPDTGEPVPDGEIGELVFTSLTKEALPIIRYRTRDLTRLLPGTARTMRRIILKNHRPQRRHDDRAGRERVSHADRGTDPARP